MMLIVPKGESGGTEGSQEGEKVVAEIIASGRDLMGIFYEL